MVFVVDIDGIDGFFDVVGVYFVLSMIKLSFVSGFSVEKMLYEYCLGEFFVVMGI